MQANASAIHRDIERSTAAFSAAIREQDLSRIGDAYTEDAVLLLEGVPEQRGRDAIVAFFRLAFAGGLKSLAFTTGQVHAYGDVAVEHGTYAMTVAGSSDQIGRYVVVHRRDNDGVWRAFFDVAVSTSAG